MRKCIVVSVSNSDRTAKESTGNWEDQLAKFFGYSVREPQNI